MDDNAADRVGVDNPWVWGGFVALVVIVMALDLGVFHRKAHQVKAREALVWVAVWVVLAVIFNVVLGVLYGWRPAIEFAGAYLIEYALSVDNIFVFVLIFAFFSVPPSYQHRVLFWGIVGAAVMRLAFILIGAELLDRFEWLIYPFGAFLLFTGGKLLFQEVEVHPEKNLVLRLARRFLRVVREFHGQKFFVRVDGRLYATPLFLVLLVVEATDVLFAVDSVPAIIPGTTRDPFIAFSSNVFAILGLRSLYFVLAGMMGRFHYLKVGLSLVLIFIGAKMCLHQVFKPHPAISFSVVLLLLAGSVGLSLYVPPKVQPLPEEGRREPEPSPVGPPAERRQDG
jgi:tellurite resistance protein TerC